jgi:hypothetical protein
VSKFAPRGEVNNGPPGGSFKHRYVVSVGLISGYEIRFPFAYNYLPVNEMSYPDTFVTAKLVYGIRSQLTHSC